jgi:hypothetical protein
VWDRLAITKIRGFSMKVEGRPYRTIWLGPDGETVVVIDQTLLPHPGWTAPKDLAT